MSADRTNSGEVVDLRLASPGSPGFATAVLSISDLEDAPENWQEHFGTDAKILCASFRDDMPVMVFLNERSELLKTLDDLKKQEMIPAGFQRMIDAHVGASPAGRNEVLLNREHRLVARARPIDVDPAGQRVTTSRESRVVVGGRLADSHDLAAASRRPRLDRRCSLGTKSLMPSFY